MSQDGPPRFPGQKDIHGLSIALLDRFIDVDVRNCVVILHDDAKTERSAHSLALRLQKELPASVFIWTQILKTIHRMRSLPIKADQKTWNHILGF